MKTLRTLGLAVVALSLAFTPIAGQEHAAIPDVGSWGISFLLPEGGGNGGFGIRRIMSERVNAGLEFTFDHRWEETQGGGIGFKGTGWGFGIHPDVRIYKEVTGRVVPFLLLATGIDYAKAANDATFTGLFARSGVGVEWFPVDAVSVVGSTGVAFTWNHTEQSGAVTDRWSKALVCYRSAITLNLYF